MPVFLVYRVTRFAIVFCECSEKVPLNRATFLRYLALKVLLEEKNVNVEIISIVFIENQFEITLMTLTLNSFFCQITMCIKTKGKVDTWPG